MAKKKILNLIDLVVLGVGSSLSIGVYVLLGVLIKNVTGPSVTVSIFLAFVAAIFAGLCFLEFGVLFLKVESFYFFCYSCHGENTAFLLSWTLVLQYIAGTASIIKGIIAFVDNLAEQKIESFLKEILPINLKYLSSYFDFISVSIVLILMFFLMCEIKNLAKISNIFTICNIVIVFSLIMAGSFKADTKNWNINESTQNFTSSNFAPYGIFGIIKGAAIAFYGFVGYEAVCLSEKDQNDKQTSETKLKHLTAIRNDAKNPHKNLPLATLVSLLIITVLYLGAGSVLSLMRPYNEQSLFAGLPFAFEQCGLPVFKWISVMGAFFGFQTSLLGMFSSTPRIICSMANDGLIFHIFGNSNPKLKTSKTAILAGGALTAIAAGFFTFHNLVNLMVAGALFVYTILAIDVIFLRYGCEEKTKRLSEEYTEDCSQIENISFNAVLRQCFNTKSKIPTKLTEKAVTMNLIIFCIFNICLSIILTFFNEYLVRFAIEVIVPAIIILIVIFISLFFIISQPRFERSLLPFQTPLIPATPCLSIFLNILLMSSLDLATWIKFLIWIIIGVFPHLMWDCYKKYYKGNESGNSLYEINRLNFVKLNESIWKIENEKKSFYEGAVNPVFYDGPEDKFEEKNLNNSCLGSKRENELLQSLETEEIPVTNFVMTEKTEPLASELQVELIKSENYDDSTEMNNNSLKNDVEEKCVAEVHTEEVEKSYELEILNNSYSFLNEVSEDSTKKEEFCENSENSDLQVKEDVESSEELKCYTNDQDSCSADLEYNKEIKPKSQDLDYVFSTVNKNDSLDLEKTKENILYELKNEIKEFKQKFNTLKDEDSSEDLGENKGKENEETFINKDDESANSSSDINLNTSKEKILKGILNEIKTEHINYSQKDIKDNNNERKMSTEKSLKENAPYKEEKVNKISEFKEKLNQLLQNQVKTDSGFKSLKNNNKYDLEYVLKENLKNSESDSYQNIKTLNKSQIKQKLDLLFSKGPPKRPSLRNSFNIKSEESEGRDKEKESNEKTLNESNISIGLGSD